MVIIGDRLFQTSAPLRTTKKGKPLPKICLKIMESKKKKKSSEMCGVNAPKYKETKELGSAFGASSSLWGVAVAEEPRC